MAKRKYNNQTIWLKRHRVNNDGVIERYCASCDTWKEEIEENFYLKNKKNPEKGFSGECKICSVKRTESNTAKKHDEVVAKISEYNRQHPEDCRRRRRKHYENNKKKERERTKQFFENNPEKSRQYSNKHRNHDITAKEWVNCKNTFDNRCAYCGLHINEHLVPRGDKIINMDLHKEHVDDEGYNDVRNCVPCCQSCNSKKGNYTIYELLEINTIKEFTQEKLNKILWWTTEGYKEYIEPKPPYRITRSRTNDENKKFHYQYELWSVNEKRDYKDLIFTANKKNEIKNYIINKNINFLS